MALLETSVDPTVQGPSPGPYYHGGNGSCDIPTVFVWPITTAGPYA